MYNYIRHAYWSFPLQLRHKCRSWNFPICPTNAITRTDSSVPKTLTLEEVETATDADKTLRGVRAAIKLKWHFETVKPFKAVKNELTVTSKGVVLRGTRIVLPQSFQQRAVDIAHASHLGLSKTKALIREKVWFPKMDEMIKTTVDQCIPCQAVGKSNPPQPIESTEMPNSP